MYWLTLFKICFSKYQSNTKRENFNKLYNLEPLNISAYMDPNFPSPLRRVGVVFEWQCNVRTQEVTCILMTVQYEVSRSYLYAFHFFLIFLNSLFWYKRKTFCVLFLFDVQNVAYDSFVMDIRVFCYRISFRVLGSINEIIVNGDYSMDKEINAKQFYLYS